MRNEVVRTVVCGVLSVAIVIVKNRKVRLSYDYYCDAFALMRGRTRRGVTRVTYAGMARDCPLWSPILSPGWQDWITFVLSGKDPRHSQCRRHIGDGAGNTVYECGRYFEMVLIV